MGEIKQTNFRINQDTADAFRRFCEENGLNQAQGFDHIMQVVELDQAKAVTPERITEIESFEKSIKDIMSAYLYSIEINNNAEARIREQFASSLDRKDKTIEDLQQKVEQLKAEKKLMGEAKKEAEKAKEAAEEKTTNAIDQMEAAKKTAADQERLNAILTGQLSDATEKLNGYEDLKESESSLKGEVAELKYELKEAETTLIHTKEMYEARLETAQSISDKCTSLEASDWILKAKIAEMERTLAEQKKFSESDLRASKDQAKLDMERAVISKEREMNSLIRESDKENAVLLAKIEYLEKQIEHQKKD